MGPEPRWSEDHKSSVMGENLWAALCDQGRVPELDIADGGHVFHICLSSPGGKKETQFFLFSLHFMNVQVQKGSSSSLSSIFKVLLLG